MIGALIVSAAVMAANPSCAKYPEVVAASEPGQSACNCGANLSGKFKLGFEDVVSSRHLSLVAVCGYSTSDSDRGEGGYFFRGDAIVTGTFFRTSSVSLGDYIEFGMDAKSRGQLPSPAAEYYSLRVGEDRRLKRALKGCGSVAATIRLTRFEHADLGGGDNDGSFLTGFDVIRWGKAQHCKRKSSLSKLPSSLR